VAVERGWHHACGPGNAAQAELVKPDPVGQLIQGCVEQRLAGLLPAL
jgi:hypothetical protein